MPPALPHRTPALAAALLLTLLAGACSPRPTPTAELPRGTALAPPGIAMQPAR